jgi:3-oxoacyl-[acyl-carrier-protein] synthase III
MDKQEIVGNVLQHFGILGMKWGIRRFQNPDGSLTPAGRKRYQKKLERLEKKDTKWAKTKGSKIKEKIEKKVSKEAEKYAYQTAGSLRNKSGKISMTFVNQYNQKLAELMNEKVGSIQSPSGKVLKFVAKRGGIGVFTALADPYANLDQYSKGIHATGRVAYKQDTVRKI